MVRLRNLLKTAQLIPFVCLFAAALLLAGQAGDAATVTAIQTSTIAWPLPIPAGDTVANGWQAGGCR